MDFEISEIKSLIELSLTEDIGAGDVTSDAVISPEACGKFVIFGKEKGVLAGISVCRLVFKMVDGAASFRSFLSDGEKLSSGIKVAEVSGNARKILSAERVALNFLSRLSGVATLTSLFVEKIRQYKTRIMDTRKTTPGWRILEKYAVRVGGGENHRMGLYDQVLIKDNHLRIAEDGIEKVIRTAKAKYPALKAEAEVSTLSEVKAALGGNPDIIMLDNMSPEEVEEAVKLSKNSGSKALLEVSGRISLENITGFAKTGVDIISVGSLTHSFRSLDFSMEVCEILRG